jgi:tRNA pseudouridine38-40 synthase
MPRYKLTIEYDGTPFAGWQWQDDAPTVQRVLTEALAGCCNHAVKVAGAGRTDAGVHALGQVAHVDLAKDWRGDKLRDAVNAHLRPHPVAILAAERAADDFDARFLGEEAPLSLSHREPARRSCAGARARLARAAPARCGGDARRRAGAHRKHDFTTFRSTECQAKSPVKTLDRLDVTRVGDEVCIETSARSFLHNQVRSMVGSLVLVGDGKWRAADLAHALAARERAGCGAGRAARGALSGAGGLLAPAARPRESGDPVLWPRAGCPLSRA